jgi:hypothetical protein
MFPTDRGFLIYSDIIGLVAGFVTGILAGAGTCLLLRLKIQGLVKDGLLGAVGFLIAFYTIVYLPWPSNAAMRPADAVAYTVAGILPVVHHVYRRVAQH